MSYQEEMLKEIADAIREVDGTTDKIPATEFASRVAGLSVVKPSGIKTITENGDYDVSNYAWASVNVEPALRERDILGGWNSTIDIGETRPIFAFGAGGVCFFTGFEGTYTINQSNVILTIPEVGGELVATYNSENDTLSISSDGDVLELIRGETVNERNIIGVWNVANILYEFKPNGELLDLATTKQGTYTISGGVVSFVIDGSSKNVMYDFLNNILINGTIGFGLTKVEKTAKLTTKEITENGTYKASDDGADGYSEVVVNVASSGGSGERDVHETLYIMKAIDNMRFEDKQIALREFPTEDEYAEQEIYINTMIKNITGVDFNG